MLNELRFLGLGTLMDCPGVTENLFCCENIQLDPKGVRGRNCILLKVLLATCKPYLM